MSRSGRQPDVRPALEPQLRPPRAEAAQGAPTYFVGRRVVGAAELFAVSVADVERLTSGRRHGAPGLDWRGATRALELSHLLLERVAEPPPSRELTNHFARSMLAPLPEHGFVLDSDTVLKWVLLASRSQEVSSGDPRKRGRWVARLLSTFRGSDG